MAGQLRLIVHDFDQDDMRARARALKRALPDADVRGFTTRRALLLYVASLPDARPGEVPVCLIDLEHPDRQGRGEQLIRTVTRHQRLSNRVALVAFTRFNHPRRAERLQRDGARGMLSPLNVEDARLRQWLLRVASGPGRVIAFGEPPSAEEDVKFLRGMVGLFPRNSALSQSDQAAALEEAVRVLTLCRLFHDGYTETAILRAGLGYTRSNIDAVRAQLDAKRAFKMGAIKEAGGKADLGAVIPEVAKFDDRSEKRVDHLGIDHHALSGLASIMGVQDVALARREPGQGGAWIPQRDLPLLDRFFELHEEERPRKNPSKADVAEASTRALARIARELESDDRALRDRVVHAMECVEGLAWDDDRDEGAGEVF
jgi:hypothetical protein